MHNWHNLTFIIFYLFFNFLPLRGFVYATALSLVTDTSATPVIDGEMEAEFFSLKLYAPFL